ncbi:hypothetical protein [Streptomyces sp. NPDC049879]|uniref:hypothetical protein n=1 Tax=Streptomyces sp. NPDC049879 TaxID=3365598 RepID=UPI0037B3AC7E
MTSRSAGGSEAVRPGERAEDPPVGMGRRATAAKAALSLAIVGMCVASCSDDGGSGTREYAVPETLCELPVEQALYEGLFPPGERAEREGTVGGVTWSYFCTWTVDGEVAFAVEAMPGGTGGLEGFASEAEEAAGEPVEIAGPYEARVWPRVAIARGACDNTGADTGVFQDSGPLTVVIRAHFPEDDDEAQAILRELLIPVMEAERDRVGCA